MRTGQYERLIHNTLTIIPLTMDKGDRECICQEPICRIKLHLSQFSYLWLID